MKQTVDEKRRRMLEVNHAQAALYDEEAERHVSQHAHDRPPPSKSGTVSQIWSQLKRRGASVKQKVAPDGFKDDLFEDWTDDWHGKRVLDLGCHVGHEFGLRHAPDAAYYLGVDLSPRAIEIFRDKLVQRDVQHGEGLAMDFLSPEFPEGDFDIVHARSVIHHFEYLDVFMQTLHARMAPGGSVIAYEPLQTAPIAQLVRALYRPFQEDRAWEWPLTKEGFRIIQKYFVIEKVQGFMGRAKWAIPLALFDEQQAIRFGTYGWKYDMEHANRLGSDLWACLQVALKLRRRG